eukprot:TRINITY_DN19601_c0_g1_i1.p1 TRINITY_DN19601_c0_g1~~TRINITY_DN19601_c0_g1_i1.p1  ORF type:complete len:214 (-),score=18.33 TRINITY_DN19601_c0_g1_i1:266-907(-)
MEHREEGSRSPRDTHVGGGDHQQPSVGGGDHQQPSTRPAPAPCSSALSIASGSEHSASTVTAAPERAVATAEGSQSSQASVALSSGALLHMPLPDPPYHEHRSSLASSVEAFGDSLDRLGGTGETQLEHDLQGISDYLKSYGTASFFRIFGYLWTGERCLGRLHMAAGSREKSSKYYIAHMRMRGFWAHTATDNKVIEGGDRVCATWIISDRR